MERPDDNDTCAECAHVFGEHATSYDGTTHGCLGQDYNTRCTCAGGFTLKWVPEG